MLVQLTPSSDYTAWLGELKVRIQSARISAARSINREMILLYWDIVRGIVEKQKELGWGDSVVNQLAFDLREAFPHKRGFSKQNVWRMRQFYIDYSSDEFLSQAVRELEGFSHKPFNKQQYVSENLSQAARELVAAVPWGHHANVLAKIESPAERLYYLRATAQFGWTRSVLLNQLKADAYGRSLAEGKMHNFPATLPEYLAEQAEEALKSSY
ncbi:MAG: DUF1016 N-terminal domain-containing protein [Gammaproteobacteria bacterium]|nr:DUF1016 N-terminal domain-containing protein [Gammaproteobacteria bacterium]